MPYRIIIYSHHCRFQITIYGLPVPDVSSGILLSMEVRINDSEFYSFLYLVGSFLKYIESCLMQKQELRFLYDCSTFDVLKY